MIRIPCCNLKNVVTMRSTQHLMFEMLRSFTTLARTLNLSETVRILKSTRQTVRRHIKILEDVRGTSLFEHKDGRYFLTQSGYDSIVEAELLIARSEAWLSGNLSHIDDLQVINIEEKTAPRYYSQQHHLTRLWRDGTPLLRHAFQCWMKAEAAIENAEFASVRPYLVLFRRKAQRWICIETGEKSALAKWFGWEWAKSSIGNFLENSPAGPSHGEYISQAYNEVYQTGCVRLDHQHRQVPKTVDGPLASINFQRLLLSCILPDGDRVLTSLSDMTYCVDILGVSEARVREMDEAFVTEFDPRTT